MLFIHIRKRSDPFIIGNFYIDNIGAYKTVSEYLQSAILDLLHEKLTKFNEDFWIIRILFQDNMGWGGRAPNDIYST